MKKLKEIIKIILGMIVLSATLFIAFAKMLMVF